MGKVALKEKLKKIISILISLAFIVHPCHGGENYGARHGRKEKTYRKDRRKKGYGKKTRKKKKVIKHVKTEYFSNEQILVGLVLEVAGISLLIITRTKKFSLKFAVLFAIAFSVCGLVGGGLGAYLVPMDPKNTSYTFFLWSPRTMVAIVLGVLLSEFLLTISIIFYSVGKVNYEGLKHAAVAVIFSGAGGGTFLVGALAAKIIEEQLWLKVSAYLSRPSLIDRGNKKITRVRISVKR